MNVNAERAKAITTLVVDAALLFNYVAQMKGWSPVSVDYDGVYEVVSAILLVIAGIWTWYKNQNVSEESVIAQEQLNVMKETRRSE